MFDFLKKSILPVQHTKPPMELQIETEHYSITCEVHFSNRRTLTLAIQKQGKSVIIKAPNNMSISTIEAFVNNKKGWLNNSLKKLETMRSKRTERIYKHGATHLVLGVPYTLCFSLSKIESVSVEGNRLEVCGSSEDRCEFLLRQWYAKEASEVFTSLARPLTSSFGTRHGKFPSRLEIKYVKTYWGVCTSRGTIRLNIELMRAPTSCIEYIIVHELCHLVHPNHSKRFYDLLSSELPDWRLRKELLDSTISCTD